METYAILYGILATNEEELLYWYQTPQTYQGHYRRSKMVCLADPGGVATSRAGRGRESMCKRVIGDRRLRVQNSAIFLSGLRISAQRGRA
jgi:hypothetical protein